MIDKIIFATGNEGKMKEVRMILKDLGLPVLSMKEAGVQADIVEDGTTFEENAKIKAVEIAHAADIDVVLMNGKNPHKLYDLFEDQPVGTLFAKKK